MFVLSKLSLLILATILWLGHSFSANAAQWAVVIKDKAIVYADPEMSASIGFIIKGKKVRVGEKTKNNGLVLPIIVSKRIAYIKTADIESSTNKDLIDNSYNRYSVRNKKNMATNRIAVLAGGALGSVYFPESPTADNQYNMLFYGGGIRVYREESNSKSGIKGSLEYMTGTRDKEEISLLSIPFDYYYKIFQKSYFELHLFGGINLIPFAEYKLADDFTLNGNGLGAQLGSELVITLEKVGIHIEASYQYNKLFGFKLPDNDIFPSSLEPSINSFGVRGMVSFAF